MNRINTKDNYYASLLGILIFIDLLFIIAHILSKTIFGMKESLFNISVDRGYAEFFQYSKFLFIIILLVYLTRSTKCLKYISWICLFTYFLIDDAFQIHETIGRYFTKGLNFNPPLNLRLQDLGELVVYTIVGILLFTIIIPTYKTNNKSFKRISKDLLLLTFVLAFFGLFVDILASAFDGIVKGLGMLEDGGEMFTISIILWYVFNIAFSKNRSEINLYLLISKIIKSFSDKYSKTKESLSQKS